jgi:anthranilate synthase/aminodeoxychorismate synthase-like glutamine amidotransferase
VETTGREAYTGAIGYASPVAGLELNVAIRTFEFAAGRVWFGAGGGVVIDSTPEGERIETLVKAAPLVGAIGARVSPLEDAQPPAVEPAARRVSLSPTLSAERPVDPGLGVFSTLLVEGGEPVDLDAHLTRLRRDAKSLYGADLPGDLDDRVRTLSSRLLGRHRVRIVARPEPHGPAIEITPSPVCADPPEPLRLAPFAVPGGLGPHKYADRSRLDGIDAGLVVDVDGSVLETWTGSVFLVTDEAVHTPALDGRQLPGITRQRVIEALDLAGIRVVERVIELVDLANAIEVFATGSIDRVRPVTEVEGVGRWPAGDLARWLTRRLADSRPSPLDHSPVAAFRSLRLLLVDNYDSFVYNLDQYVRELGAQTHVVRNDALDLDGIAATVAAGRLHGIVISPGPGTPTGAGLSTALVRRLGASVPILGVCLGHQCIAAAYGARIVPAATVVHGKPSIVHHDGKGVYAGLDAPIVVGRYHSLVVPEDGLPVELVVTARTGDGAVMGLRHREHPVEGVQFHPESILSPRGHHLLAKFLWGCSVR